MPEESGGKTMSSHGDILRRLSAYCGGDLEPAERQLVELHLAECPTCRAELADLQTTLHLVRTTPEIDPPPWMTTRIMALIREQQTEKKSWLQRFFFPLHLKLPLEAIALLVVCVSGYYLTRTVETNLEQTRQQQLQETPAQSAPAPASSPVQRSDGNDARKRTGESSVKKDTTHTVAPESAPQPEYSPEPTVPVAPPAYAPPPPAFRDQQSGKSELMKAAPAAESYDRALEAAPEKKMKSSRSAERQADTTAPAAAGRTAGAPTGMALSQAVVRLNVNDPAAAVALIREAVRRSGGEIINEREVTGRHLTARLPAARQKELLDRLERLGRITERPGPAPASAQSLELTIQW
jgi:cytoskeletal protein RodZ